MKILQMQRKKTIFALTNHTKRHEEDLYYTNFLIFSYLFHASRATEDTRFEVS